jgi:thiol:disulfide interchange protein
MLSRKNRILSVLLLAGLALICANARGDDSASRAELIKAALNVTALRPGKPAMAAVVVDVKPGFHAQSHTPSQEYLIKFQLKVDDNPSLTFGESVYPDGEVYNTKTALGMLNVYTGRIIVRFPVEVKSGAAMGDVKIKGSVRFQVCDDNVCYPPVKTPFEIATSIVPADQAVQPNEAELFQAPVAAAATQPAATQPTTRPAPATLVTPTGGAPESGGYTVPVAFAVAFLAGLIFNVMPCVLPVLPLKAMGFYEASKHNRARSLGLGAAFSLGVIASFGVLGVLVVVLKLFQWGQIYSNPWFLGGLIAILLAMAFFTFGFFTIRLPNAIYSVSPRHDTFFGNILFGILTAVLSTPCTFGLFAGLLVFALNQSTVIGMALMFTVGVGMASPYFLLSAFPEAARRFPRTGPWAEVVKQVLGFLLLLMAAYFAERFVEPVVGLPAFWWGLFAILAAAALFIVVRAFQFSKTSRGPIIAVAVAMAMVVPGIFAARWLSVRPYTWQPYSASALAQARSSNRVVLVEFTASWCTTCHTLEALVLNNHKIVEAVDRNNIQMMRADLSAEDAPGWALLRDDLHHEGVPLTAVYVPGMEQPIQLSGWYTTDDLKRVIAEASDRRQVNAVARGG